MSSKKTKKTLVNNLHKNATQRILQSDTLVSIATATFNDGQAAVDAILEMHSVLLENFNFYELIVVDLSSDDGTIELIQDLQKQLPHIRLLVLSKRYSIEIAFAAALENSIGDYVVLIDSIYDPPSYIPEMVKQAINGNDIVIGLRKDRHDLSWINRHMISTYYWVSSKILGYPLSPFASYYRLYSRRAVNSIIRIKNKSRYLKYFNAMMGFRQTTFEYERINRRPDLPIKRGLHSSISLAIDVLVSNSSRPLRISALIGFVAGLLNLGFLLYVFVIILIQDQVAQGWVSTSVMNATMFFLLFMILAVMSEYIARILNEAKDQPLYFLADEYESSINSRIIDRANIE